MGGTFPVTHLLRGKYWLQSHHADDVGGVEPPRIYVRLANADQSQMLGTHRIDYKPGIGDDRHYPANISIFEVLELLRNRLLIPRPYGPRVPLSLAADVLRTVLPQQRRDRATAAALTGKGLHRNVHWVRSSDLPGRDDQVLAAQFRDGFAGVPVAEVAKRIVAANPAEFAAGGQRLRDGWRRLVIPENTVDIFQAYTALVLEPLGVAVDWVDSWYYHVRFGGIHCGTNVLRQPDPSLVPWWRR